MSKDLSEFKGSMVAIATPMNIDGSLDFEGVWIHLLAYLTFETLPVKRAYVLVLGIWWFFLFLSQHPVLQALEVDETNGTSALASNDKRIVGVFLRTPADSALDLVLVGIIKILNTFHFLSFLEFLVIELALTHRNLITFEVFYSKSHAT